MTFIIKKAHVNGISIEISVEKFETCYHVRAARIIEPGICGYDFTDLIYPTEKKATARFNYLRRKAEKGDL
jgi:hypothetical protein